MDQSKPNGPPPDEPGPRTPREEALERALQDADRRKDELLAALGHELRNPMSALATSVHLLRQDRITPESRARALDIMQRQIFAMSTMVDDMLELSRLNRGKIEMIRQVLDLAAHVASTVEDHRWEIESRRLGLDLVIPETPLWVDGDPGRLSQAVLHVLRNAAEHAPADSRIEVRVAEDDGSAEVTVSRAGAGRDPRSPDLFNPFGPFVAQPGAGRPGLGLSLARGIVALHGGRVQAESDGPDLGARLKMWLPLVAAPAPLLAPGEGDEDASGLDVLIIEDNEDAAEMLAMLLSVAGHRPRIATRGEAGVEAARQARPDAVLCDLRLPGRLDGCAVARMIRADASLADVFLVALSGSGEKSDRDRSREAGFDLHLTKPIQPDQLDRILREGRPPGP